MRMQTLWKMVFTGLIISIAASGATLTRPYGPSDYAGGAKAVGTKINSEFANIVSWLNGQNISSSNIVSFGVTETNLAPNSVTTTKIFPGSIDSDRLASNSVTTAKILDQSVTNNKIADGTIMRTKLVALASALQNPVDVASFNNQSSTAPTRITPDVLLTTGQGGLVRPVMATLLPDTTATSLSGIRLDDNSAASSTFGAATFTMYFYKDGVRAGAQKMNFLVGRNGSQSSASFFYPLSSFEFIDPSPTAGAHTYAIFIGDMNASTTNVAVSAVRLYVREL